MISPFGSYNQNNLLSSVKSIELTTPVSGNVTIPSNGANMLLRLNDLGKIPPSLIESSGSSSIQSVNNVLPDVNSNVNLTINDIPNLGTSLTNIQNDISSINGDILNVNSVNSTQTQNINTLSNNLTTLGTRTTNTENSITTINNTLENLTLNNLDDVLTSSVIDKDILRYDSTTSKFINSNTLTSLETTVKQLQNFDTLNFDASQSVVGATQNQIIATNYTTGNYVFQNNVSPKYLKPNSVTCNLFTVSQTIIDNWYDNSDGSGKQKTVNNDLFLRINYIYNSSFQADQFVLKCSWGSNLTYPTDFTQPYIKVYGSNTLSDINLTDNYGTATELFYFSPEPSINTTFTFTYNIASNYPQYRYFSIRFPSLINKAQSLNIREMQIRQAAGGYTPLTKNVDFSITYQTNGKPNVVYSNALTSDLIINLDQLAIDEMYSKIYSVVRTTSQINLGTWIIRDNLNTLEFSNGTLRFSLDASGNLLSNLDKLSDVVINTPTLNQSLIYNGSSWVNQQINHTTLSNIGTNTHADIDVFIASKGVASGLCPLNSLSKINNVYLSEVIPLTNLSDVTITTPSNGQVLSFNGTNWINSTFSSGSSNLSGLTDVTITSLSTSNALIYNGSSWVNQQINHTTLSNIGTNTHAQIDAFISSKGQANGICALDSSSKIGLSFMSEVIGLTNISDVIISTPSTGQVLSYNGTNWINSTVSSGSSSLSGLTDVILTTPSSGQVLSYNGTKWVNSAASSGTTSPLTTKGDLYVYSTTNTRLPIGANNQLLIADSTTATGLRWGLLNIEGYFNDIAISNITDGDVLVWDNAGNTYRNSQNLINLQNTVSAMNTQMTTVGTIVKSQSGVVQNGTITLSYTDSTDGTLVYAEGQPVTALATSFKEFPAPSQTTTISVLQNSAFNELALYYLTVTALANTYFRINYTYGQQFKMINFTISMFQATGLITNRDIRIYGSNNIADASASSLTDYTGMNLIYTHTYNQPAPNSGWFSMTINIPIESQSLFQYYSFRIPIDSEGYAHVSELRGTASSGSPTGIVVGTNYTLTTASNGQPLLTYTSAATSTLSYNLTNIYAYELQRRVFPVIRGDNDVRINNVWKLSNNGSGKFTLNNGADRMLVGAGGIVEASDFYKSSGGSYVSHNSSGSSNVYLLSGTTIYAISISTGGVINGDNWVYESGYKYTGSTRLFKYTMSFVSTKNTGDSLIISVGLNGNQTGIRNILNAPVNTIMHNTLSGIVSMTNNDKLTIRAGISVNVNGDMDWTISEFNCIITPV